MNGIRPTGVEISTIERGSSASAEIAEPNAESRHGGAAPDRITTRSALSFEPSHHEPGRLHLIANKAFK